jgi:hypothetical protein
MPLLIRCDPPLDDEVDTFFMTVDEIVCPSTSICGKSAWLRLAAAARAYPAGHAVPSTATLSPFRSHGCTIAPLWANTWQHYAAVAMRRISALAIACSKVVCIVHPIRLHCCNSFIYSTMYSIVQDMPPCRLVTPCRAPPLRSACAILSSRSLWPNQLC